MTVPMDHQHHRLQRAQARITGMATRAGTRTTGLRQVAEVANRSVVPTHTSRTGRLAAGMRNAKADASRDRAVLIVDVPYAGYVIHGTHRQRAQPPRIDESMSRPHRPGGHRPRPDRPGMTGAPVSPSAVQPTPGQLAQRALHYERTVFGRCCPPATSRPPWPRRCASGRTPT